MKKFFSRAYDALDSEIVPVICMAVIGVDVAVIALCIVVLHVYRVMP